MPNLAVPRHMAPLGIVLPCGMTRRGQTLRQGPVQDPCGSTYRARPLGVTRILPKWWRCPHLDDDGRLRAVPLRRDLSRRRRHRPGRERPSRRARPPARCRPPSAPPTGDHSRHQDLSSHAPPFARSTARVAERLGDQRVQPGRSRAAGRKLGPRRAEGPAMSSQVRRPGAVAAAAGQAPARPRTVRHGSEGSGSAGRRRDSRRRLRRPGAGSPCRRCGSRRRPTATLRSFGQPNAARPPVRLLGRQLRGAPGLRRAARHVLPRARGGRRRDGQRPVRRPRHPGRGPGRGAGPDGDGRHPVHGQRVRRAPQPGGQPGLRRARRLPVAARARTTSWPSSPGRCWPRWPCGPSSAGTARRA